MDILETIDSRCIRDLRSLLSKLTREWFVFSNQRTRERLLEWLRDKEIDVEYARSNGG